jgi:hypothetical protein
MFMYLGTKCKRQDVKVCTTKCSQRIRENFGFHFAVHYTGKEGEIC